HPDESPVSAEVPLMIGATRTELTTSSDDAAFSLSAEGLRARIDTLLGDKAARTIDVYRNANPQATPSDLYFLIASDYRYGAPVMMIAERRAALGAGPVYLYYFRRESPYDGGRLRSPHTIEIPFAVDSLDKSQLTAGSPTAPALADKVSDAWLAFARTGNPSTLELPAWPPYDAGKRATMVFDDVSAVAEDPIGAERTIMFEALYRSYVGTAFPTSYRRSPDSLAVSDASVPPDQLTITVIAWAPSSRSAWSIKNRVPSALAAKKSRASPGSPAIDARKSWRGGPKVSGASRSPSLTSTDITARSRER